MENNTLEELIARKITKPYNEAWKVIKLVLDDNSDEAWNKYVDAIDDFHKKLSTAQNPREFGYLKALYSAVDYAGELIGQYQEVNKNNKTGGSN